MANGLMPLAGLWALYLVCSGCGSDQDSDVSSSAGAPATESAPTQPTHGTSGANAVAGGPSGEDSDGSGSGGAHAEGGATSSAGSSEKAGVGPSVGPPPVDGRSIYALECHGDSKDCNGAIVPCFGVSSPVPNVAAGWACANRCVTSADCSAAPSGAEAQAACVPFTSAGHCMLVCQNENQSFSCPDGMTCYAPPKSPVGYCLWQ
jgi:hypothetical protein